MLPPTLFLHSSIANRQMHAVYKQPQTLTISGTLQGAEFGPLIPVGCFSVHMLSGQQLAFFPTGLLRLEELIRRFLISRETLSIRMLDDNLDPTPLLKEIRDDKIATIIIDANASISYLILKKVSIVTFVVVL